MNQALHFKLREEDRQEAWRTCKEKSRHQRIFLSIRGFCRA